MSKLPEIIETGMIQTVPVDNVCIVRKVGSMTHIVFAETQPDTRGELYRVVTARISVPSDLVILLGRTILAGVTTAQWILPNEPDHLGIRTEH